MGLDLQGKDKLAGITNEECDGKTWSTTPLVSSGRYIAYHARHPHKGASGASVQFLELRLDSLGSDSPVLEARLPFSAVIQIIL
ncbi:Uncharacterised protein [Serratia fonticola]|nr:Uncharacterised protein [Serratia fonticola]